MAEQLPGLAKVVSDHQQQAKENSSMGTVMLYRHPALSHTRQNNEEG